MSVQMAPFENAGILGDLQKALYIQISTKKPKENTVNKAHFLRCDKTGIESVASPARVPSVDFSGCGNEFEFEDCVSVLGIGSTVAS